MSAGKYCNREVIVTAQDASITEAAELMRLHHVGDLVVVKNQQGKTFPIGIITDRDLVIEIIALKIDPEAITVKDVMRTDVVTVNEDESLLDVLETMQEKGVRRIVVVDNEGELQGLLSADDAIELIAEAMNDLTRLVRREMAQEQTQRP